MDSQSQLIDKFCATANVAEGEARHLLEAFQWNFDEAVRSYFELNDSSGERDSVPSDPVQGNFGNSSSTTSGRINRGVVGFDSIRSQNQDEPEGQAFYVGGSERGGGGQQVLGPPRKDKQNPDPTTSPDQFVHDLFNAAKGRGAEVLDTEHYDPKSKPGPSLVAFTGAGYRLGEDPNQTSVVDCDPSNPTSTPFSGSAEEENEKSVVVKMWRDGFSLDDGPLRSYTDPASQAFLDEIKAGHVPQELIKSAAGGLVNLLLEDHHHEAWSAPPPPKMVPFSGKGTMLGHPTPRIAPVVSSTTNQTCASIPALVVDDSGPVTQMQVRLPDGGRLVLRLNHSHTIRDVRQAIMNQRPNLSSCQFTLQTTYPNRILSEEGQTVEEAKLLNSSVLVRLA